MGSIKKVIKREYTCQFWYLYLSVNIFAVMWSYLLHETDQYNQIEMTAVAVLCEL